jgi:hypothetical protein
MSRSPQSLPVGVRLSDKLMVAELHKFFPLDVVTECLRSAEKSTQRVRELPNEFMTYYPAILCMYRDASQQEALRCMAEGLYFLHGLRDFKVTGKSGISQARSRVGSAPIKAVFDRCAVPLAKPGSVGCFYKGLRLVAIDGSELNLDDCPENDEYFGRSKNQHGAGAYPKANIVGLVEIGTRAVFGLSVGKYKASENELALDVIPKLTTGMVCIADQLFMSFKLFKAASETGAELLFRGREDRKVKKEQVLSDGSFITTIYDSQDDRKREHGIKVRCVEFNAEIQFLNGSKTITTYRLFTTLLDHESYPLDELAALYRERWEFETMLDELKTHLMGSQPLRSRTPDLVIQEAYGMVMAHYAIRAIMYDAAKSTKLDPDELSFTHSKNVVVRSIPKIGAFPPSTTSCAYP